MIFLLPMLGLHACDFCGFLDGDQQAIYSVQGRDAGSIVEYTGTAVITRVGNVFSVQWVFDDGRQLIGTGLKTGDILSVAYADNNGLTNPGVIAYSIFCENRLRGRYVNIGQSDIGEQTLKRIH